jgi:SAM-dependent methyltransferase
MSPVGSSGAMSVAAFNLIAERYDDIFTRTTIGRVQRSVVWKALAHAFPAGSSVLELNCGTGEDALFLARRGVAVTACDASGAMIALAQRRQSFEAPQTKIEFRVLANECIQQMKGERIFNGAFSNFSGLNCVEDIRGVAKSLAALLAAPAPLLVCLSTRVCLWEVAWYLAHACPRKAFRRFSGRTIARVEGLPVPVWYPTLRRIRATFSPWFHTRSVRAIGLFVPPSYTESWAHRNQRWIAALAKIDDALRRWPVLRGVGDHVLLEFERKRS